MSFNFQKINDILIKPVVNTFFPPICFLCGSFLEKNRKIVCKNCWSEMEKISDDELQIVVSSLIPNCFNNVFVLYKFSERFKDTIHFLKYKDCLTISEYFAWDLIAHFGPSFFAKYDIITAVPLHSTKQRERGYNQSDEIIKHIDGNIVCGILKRIKHTASQTKLNKEERIANVKYAFEFTGTIKNKNKVLLFDDILTTGSTLNACAEIWKKNGCKVVDVMALATPLSKL